MLKITLPVALFAIGLSGPVFALPYPGLPDPTAGESNIIQVYGGCGPYGHRGPYGGCRPGGQAGGYMPGRSCPPGFHLGGGRRRCWPNRY